MKLHASDFCSIDRLKFLGRSSPGKSEPLDGAHDVVYSLLDMPMTSCFILPLQTVGEGQRWDECVVCVVGDPGAIANACNRSCLMGAACLLQSCGLLRLSNGRALKRLRQDWSATVWINSLLRRKPGLLPQSMIAPAHS
ncbi:MAG: hypothetical protein SQA66_11445 [Candidatus Fervidibacter sacchari]